LSTKVSEECKFIYELILEEDTGEYPLNFLNAKSKLRARSSFDFFDSGYDEFAEFYYAQQVNEIYKSLNSIDFEKLRMKYSLKQLNEQRVIRRKVREDEFEDLINDLIIDIYKIIEYLSKLVNDNEGMYVLLW